MPVLMLDDIDGVANVLQAEALPLDQIGACMSAAGRGVMAQLSDDCFAFNGPLLPVADAERLIAERVAPVAGHETCAIARGARPRARRRHRRAGQCAAVR